MKILILVVLTVFIFSGCEDPTKTETIHTKLVIEKVEVLVLNKVDLINELKSKIIPYSSEDYNISTTYIVFKFWVDSYVGVTSDYQLECGVEKRMSWYAKSQSVLIKDGFETGALVVFTKQELDNHNCLQAGGQLKDLTGSLYGYAEYTQNRTTPTKHTVTSNSITYTAQEINEAFALFNE